VERGARGWWGVGGDSGEPHLVFLNGIHKSRKWSTNIMTRKRRKEVPPPKKLRGAKSLLTNFCDSKFTHIFERVPGFF
jgi:hypothetical protein